MASASLRRPAKGRIIAGVCQGLADHLEVPVRWARIAMVVFVLLGGAGAVLYVWLWIFVPATDRDEAARVTEPKRHLTRATHPRSHTMLQPSADAGDPLAVTAATSATASASATATLERLRRLPIAEILLGLGLIGAGVGVTLTQAGVQLHLELVLPALAALVGVGLTWWQFADRSRPNRALLPRVLAALALVAVGVLMFFITASEPSVFTVIAAAFAVLAGVALAIAPWLLRLNRELVEERAGRAREAERVRITAHLHDSVLQTLALIQQRSEPGTEVARLARSQERELRKWLFQGPTAGSESGVRAQATDELRALAAELEHTYPVRFEVIAVGAQREVAIPEPLVLAAREAMLNAAQHAGGDVTVFFEMGAGHGAIDVTDRGPGFDPLHLPAERMGVRDSIIGRMRAAGGTAQFVPGPSGTGTSVRLRIACAPEHAAPGPAEPSATKLSTPNPSPTETPDA